MSIGPVLEELWKDEVEKSSLEELKLVFGHYKFTFSKLDCSTSSYHNSTNTGPIDMFFTKKYNYFSQEKKMDQSQSPIKGCNCSLKMTSDFICHRLYLGFYLYNMDLWLYALLLYVYLNAKLSINCNSTRKIIKIAHQLLKYSVP